jgi:hypothetical protein
MIHVILPTTVNKKKLDRQDENFFVGETIKHSWIYCLLDHQCVDENAAEYQEYLLQGACV